jgi:ribonuclease Z
MDHIAGLGYYLSQRHFQGMKPGTILLPMDLAGTVEDLLKCWRQVERQATPFKIIPMIAGEMHEVRRDFGIRAFSTHHGGGTLGYSLISIREKLKPEYSGIAGPELARMRKEGVQIQYRTEVPLVAFLGDTTEGAVFDQPDVQAAQVLVTECTFFEPAHRAKSKAGKHLHLEQFVDLLPKLKNQNIVLTHVTRRTSIRRAMHLLRKRLGDEQMNRIHFLMDFEGSRDAGDVEATLQLPDDAGQ